MDYEIVIIGGGGVGLACAAVLSQKGLPVLLAERHKQFGTETSSRNSEVIHAGIYYPKDSLKAILCANGNRSLVQWCSDHNVPYNRTGKFIVAINPEEEDELEKIFLNGKNNGVENLVKYPITKLTKDEPYIKAVSALWSPDTGIVDSHRLIQSFEEASKQNRCDFAMLHELTAIEKINGGFSLSFHGPDKGIYTIKTRIIINAAGLNSDIVAELAGIDVDSCSYRLHYCKGHYFRIKPAKSYLAKHLIYPVPQKNSTGLGIHVTLDLAGHLKLGPDTKFLNDRLQDYSVPDNLHEKFYFAASQYITNLNMEDIYPDQSGIRPKIKTIDGSFRDFIIKEESDKLLPGLINLIGIESPGLTCCIEIARYVKNLVF